MGVYRATDKKSEQDVFKATKNKSYDTALIDKWQRENDTMFSELENFYKKIDNKEYLSANDLTSYKKTLERYINNSNRLRGFGSYTDDENAQWDEDVKGMNDYYDAWSSFYGKYSDEDDFKARGVNDIWNSQFYAKYGDMSYDEFEEAMTSVREQYNAARAPSLDGNTFREVPEELEREYKYLQDYYGTYTEKDKYLKEHGDLYATVSQDDGARGWEKYISDIESQQQAAIEAHENRPWWEKALEIATAGFSAPSDTYLGSGMMQATIDAYRKDVSYAHPQDDWSEEQKAVFGKLYLESPLTAYKYAEKTNVYNKTVAEEEARKKLSADATKNFGAGLGHTLGAIAAAPTGLADFFDDMAKMAAGRDPSVPDGKLSPFEYSQAVTESISTNLNEISGVLDESIPILGGKGLGDVYGLGTSILQSAASAYTLGPTGTLISYFGQGAAAGMDDALARGATPGQAAIYGTALGVFEGVAESIGIDNLFKIGASSTVKEFIINTLKQAGAEGLEEGLTSILSNITDAVVMQDKSRFDALVEQYKANGMSDKDAKWKVFWGSVEDILFDSFSGAVSGGVHGSAHTLVQTGVDNIKQAQVGKAVRNTNGLADATMARALEMQGTKASDLASKIQSRTDGGKRVGNMAYGKLYSSMSDSQISSTFQAQLGENSRGIADTITDLVKGREVSDKALRSLMASEKGLSILNETLGTSVTGENSLKDVRKSIGDALDMNTAQRAAEVGVEAFRGMSQSQAAAKIESRLSTGKGQISDKVQRQKLAATVADIVKGEDVSRSDINAALANERARNVLGEYLGVKLTEKSSAKDVRMAIAEQQNDHSPRSQARTYAAILNMDSNGTRGLASIVENTSGDIGDVAQAYNALYRAGVNGIAINEAKNKYLSLLTPEQRQYAYQTGVVDGLMERGRKNSSEVLQKGEKDAKINNNKESGENEQGIRLRDGSERDGGQDPGGQISSVEGSTGQAEGGRKDGNTNRPRDREAASLAYEKEVSAKSLGIKGGLDSGRAHLIAEGSETNEMKKARARAEKRGKKVTFFAGGNLRIEQGDVVISARGYIEGDNVYVRVDHPYYTADQLMRHELGHDMIARGEVNVDEVRERINDCYEDVDFIVERYTEAYEGSGLDADEIWEEIICDSLGDMNIFASVEVLGEMNDEFLEALKEESRKSQKDARGPPRSAEGKASKEIKSKKKPTYLSFSKVGMANVEYIRSELTELYRGIRDGIADGIAITNNNTVYIVDSGKENGKIDFGVRRKRTISNATNRLDFIRRTNNDAISKGHVSDGLSVRLGNGTSSDTGRNLRRESGAELSADKEKSPDNQSGVSGKNADNRGLKGKASQDLDFVDFLNENMEERERSNREILANLLETEDMSPSEKGFLTKYKNKIAQIEANEAEISEMESELKELRKAGKKDSAQAIALEGKIENRRREIARDENIILNLESTNSIKRLLKREKDAAYAEGMLAGQMAQGKDDAAKLRRAEERLADQKRRSDETLAEYRKRVAEREAEIKQKSRERLAEQREKARENLDTQAKRYQESRKKATEGRHKTAMRHKIAGVVSELDKLLRKGTKERNVKIGLQDAVAAALELFDMNEEKVERYNKAIADLDARIAATTDPIEIEALTALREKKVRNGERLADKLQVMKKAYEDIHNGRDGENYPSYYKAECEAIENRIAEVMEKVGDTSIGEMSLEQLEAVYGMYRMVLTTVQNANKVFKNGKLADLTADATDMTSELQRIKKLAEERLKAGDDIRSFVWNELTPYYAFNRIGSETLMSYYHELIRGQDVYARDIEEAQKFAEDTRKKHGYGKWKLDQVYNFKDKDGRDFRLTLRHMMSIYAYSKREQALDHMENGGFFFNNKETFRKKAGVLEFIASNESGYKVDARIFAQIKGALTAEQIAYVDEMQAYLTKMGDKGNEVTRVMWGIDIFKEAVYFPLKSKEDFIYQANTPAETSSLKNDGMTKETRPHASNPIVLESFDDVWANHVEKMSKYHGFVIPIDNLNKLINYGTWMSGEAETHAESHSHQNRDLVSKRLSASDLKEYLNAGSRQNKSKVRALNDGKQLILTSENEIADFIDDSIKGEHGLTTVAYGRVADRLSSDVDTYSKGKIDISNYYLELVPNDINHAFKEHTNAKQDGDIDLSLNDFHNIPNYLDNYDELVYAIQFESGATRICVSKKIDTGRVILIETVSKSRGSIEFKNIIGVSEEKYNSAYKDKYKKGNKPNSGGSRSSNISPLDEFVSNNSIPPSDENVNRNFSTNSEMGSHSISTMLEARFGPGVNDYLNTFIKDLNGAKAQSGGRLGSAFNLLSKFKKTSVAASLSVVVQQPTAIIRALSEIDARYFVGMPKPEILNRKWERMKKYAPIVILKDIGGFDAGSGRQITEWLNADTKRGVDKAMNKADDLTMYGAALGDRIGWASIWTAVEREVQAKQKPEYGSEAFYEAVGKRFTEVIVKTQVYDSTLSRSGFMRGKDGLMKMATAFMGEPTLSVNMMADAILQVKRGKIKKARAVRVIASVYVATVAASVIKSLIYALRDDDEDESYAEKYLQALGGEMRLNLNPLTMPLTMLPIFRDVVSIFDGWDVERTDMALVADLKNAIDALNSDTKSDWRKIEDFAGAIAAFAGVPLKNVMRTAREIYNLFENVFDGIEGGDLGGALGEGITGKEAGKRESLYNALISGDAERIGQYRANYDTEEKYLSAVRQALREYDPRVQRAVEGILSGDSGLYNEMKNAVKAEKYFDVKTVNNAFADEKEYVLGKLNDARKAKREGNTEEYNKIIKQLVERGYSEEFIKKKLK